jgi:DNA repair protein RadA/Sms
MAMVLAVLDRRAKIKLAEADVYAATVGGVKLSEPAADLALALAVASSCKDWPMATGLVAVGEVGLAGEVRPVSAVGRRLAEAARLGFTRALVPVGSGPGPEGLIVTEVPDLDAALRAARLA